MFKSSTNRGIGKPALLFIMAVFGAIFYFAYQIVPFYYNYHEFAGHMEAQARRASEYSDDEIKEFLMSKVDKLNIPIENDYDLEVSRNDYQIYMYLEYTEELWVSFGEKDYKLWEFPFVAEVERDY